FSVGQVHRQQLVLRRVAGVAAADDGGLPDHVKLQQLAVFLQVDALEVLAQPRAHAARNGFLRAGINPDARTYQNGAIGHAGLVELGRLGQRLARVVKVELVYAIQVELVLDRGDQVADHQAAAQVDALCADRPRPDVD